MMPYYEQIVQNIRPTLLVLFGAVGVRAADRLRQSREPDARARGAAAAGNRASAPRSAPNAARIVQQLLTESVLMSLIGGALGRAARLVDRRAFVASRPTTVPRIDLVAVDLRVLAFAAVLSIVTGIVFGLVPALRASSRGSASARSKQSGARIAAGAVAAVPLGCWSSREVALALVLLVGAGLMIRSFATLIGGRSRLRSRERRHDARHAAAVQVPRIAAAGSRFTTSWFDACPRFLASRPPASTARCRSKVAVRSRRSSSEGQPLPAPGAAGRRCACSRPAAPTTCRRWACRCCKGALLHAIATPPSAAPVVIVDETLVAEAVPGRRIRSASGSRSSSAATRSPRSDLARDRRRRPARAPLRPDVRAAVTCRSTRPSTSCRSGSSSGGPRWPLSRARRAGARGGHRRRSAARSRDRSATFPSTASRR